MKSLGKTRMVKRARRAKVKFRYFSDNQERKTKGEPQKAAKEV